MTYILDLTDAIDPEEMSLCPYCSNAILTTGLFQVISSGGAVGLAHVECLSDDDGA